VETSPIIAELDPLRNVIYGGFAGLVGGPVDELVLHRTVHRFRQGIIIAYPSPPDGLQDTEFPEFLTELRRGVVTAAVAVKPNSV
jgi:hypothetical protein